MNKVLVFVALETEFVSAKDLPCEIIYTGVGKVNAARKVTESIYKFKPDLVINIGTAGALNSELKGLYFVKDVIEHDMKAEPLSPRGVTPFDNAASIFTSDIGDIRCATGDSFVTEIDPWLLENNVSIVDMELFAIAKICEHYNIPWRSMKYISDFADENSGKDWENSLKLSQIKLQEGINKLFS